MKKSIVCLLLASVLLCACQSGKDGAPLGMKRASPQSVNYSLFVPSDWIVDTAENSFVTTAHVSDADFSNISMMYYTNDGGYETAGAYFDEYRQTLNKMFDLKEDGSSSLEMVTDGETGMLGGSPSETYVYTATLGGVELKYMQVMCLRGASIYVFTFTSHKDLYDKALSDVEWILSEFKFDG